MDSDFLAKGMKVALRDSIAIGIHNQNFKNGAFKDSIPRSAEIVDALNILIASDLLLPSEKKLTKNCRKAWIQHREAWTGSSDKYEQLLNMIDANQYFEALFEMFKNDAESRGLHVPPMMVQTMNRDGSVHETTTFDSDGLPSTFEGGVMGVPTGAPEGFAEHMKKFTASCGLSGDKSEASNKNDNNPKETKEKTESKKDSQDVKNTKITTDENKKPKSKKDAPLFGKDFARNMRGAFM